MRGDGFRTNFLLLIGPFVIWGGYFLVAYVFAALACARGWAGASVLGFSLVPASLILMTLIALAGTGALVAVASRYSSSADPDYVTPRRFARRVTILGGILGAVAIAWNAFPAFLANGCG